jgi:UDP-hydrolysing UDP-N-acetyl-D-glucosamine 2-epimerase
LRVAVLTTGRQDYGVLRGIVKLMETSPDFDLQLLVGGMHLSLQFGHTIDQIKADGLFPFAELQWIGDQGDAAIDEQSAMALQAVGEILRENKPDCLVLVGDRFETMAAALAATFELVPIVHLHGGEETEGAIDNVLRHAITKLSHLHFVSHPIYADRVIQMGEHPNTVHVVGAPGLDNLFRPDLPSRGDLEDKLGIDLKSPVVIVTLHPVTASPSETFQALENLLVAMSEVQATYVITLPNADTHNQFIRKRFIDWSASRQNVVAVEALGERFFHVLMREADLMVGNSSSAMVEAPAYQLPVIDIGSRQKGRLRAKNIKNVPADTHGLASVIRELLQPEWRKKLEGTTSPYGDGKASQRIFEILQYWQPPKDPQKSFYSLR